MVSSLGCVFIFAVAARKLRFLSVAEVNTASDFEFLMKLTSPL